MAKDQKVIGNIEHGRGGQPAPARWTNPLEEMDRLFDEFFSRGMARPQGWGRALAEMAGGDTRLPRVDVIDRETDLLVRAELPGVDKKDLDVTVNENSVTIKAESRREEKQEEGNYFRCEISRASFARTVGLPSYVDTEKAKAGFKDGILELTLPKVEQSRRRRIDVE